MFWSAEELAEFIGKYLGPAFKNSEYSQIDIWMHDDQKERLPTFIEPMLFQYNVMFAHK